jgi:hypothetical protein
MCSEIQTDQSLTRVPANAELFFTDITTDFDGAPAPRRPFQALFEGRLHALQTITTSSPE